MAAGPLGFVAAGRDRRAARTVPAVWTSADGSAWSRVAAGPGGPFLDGQAIEGVAVGRAGAVAVGTIRTGAETDAMAWFSPDGVSWRTVPGGTAGLAAPADQAVHAVTATADGFVAVGDDRNADRRFAVVWTSADGITWQRQPSSPDMAELTTGDSTRGVSATAVTGSGPVVAAGGGYALQIWSSADGRRWARNEPPPTRLPPDARVATDGRSLLLVAGSSALWLRPPGGAWRRVGADAPVFPTPTRPTSISALVRLGGRYVALGDDGGVAVWVSPDARAWRRQDVGDVFGDGDIAGVTALGGVLVAAGSAGDAAPPARRVAAAWTSTDGGTTWKRLDQGNPAFSVREVTQLVGVTAGGPGLVAVGLSYEVGRSIQAQAWSSADGTTWRRAVDPPAWSGPGDNLLNIACPLPGGGVVALGTTTVRGNQDVWAWVSTDGVSWERAADTPLGGPGAQYPDACTSTAAGVLVTGISGGEAVLWRTADGRAWTTVDSLPEVRGGAGIAADGSRLVVSGQDDGDLVMLTSADAGATWSTRRAARFAGFGRQYGSPVITGDEVVVAGVDGPVAGVWIGPAP